MSNVNDGQLKSRRSTLQRTTLETNISLSLNLDGDGISDVKTPVGFLNHMLQQIAKHGLFDLIVSAKGDIEIDTHHTIEDTAILLGWAIDQALGERGGIVRMADVTCPLDEALTQVVIDLSGRGYAVVDMGSTSNLGEFSIDMARHFFEAMAIEGRFCIHVRVLAGLNHHHIIESAFKAFARAMRSAVSIDPRLKGSIPSTKGSLTALPQESKDEGLTALPQKSDEESPIPLPQAINES